MILRVEITDSAVDEGGDEEILLALGPDDRVTLDGVPVHGVTRVELVGADSDG